MVGIFRIAAALLGALLLVSSPARADWLEARSSHFLIYADMPEARLRDYAQRLERYDRALRLITRMPDNPGEGGGRLTVYVVSGLDELRAIFGNRNSDVAGFYVPSAQGSFAITPRGLGDNMLDANQVLLHEYAHHILLSGDSDYYPGWVSEGMAEFFMTAQERSDGSLFIGAPNMARVYSVMAPDRMPARTLLDTDGRRLDPIAMDQKYSRGWLLIHYLLLGGERGNQFTDYIRRVNSGTPSVEAGRQAFGDLGRLDLDLDSYRRRPDLPVLRLTSEQLVTGPVEIRPLRAGEAAMMPVRIRSARGVTPETAPLLVPDARRIAQQYPDDPWVQRALAEVEFDANHDAEAEAACDRALAADPNQVMALIYKGRVHARRAAAAQDAGPDLWREARSWFLRANRIEPNFALPLALYYDSFVRAGQAPTDNAVNGLLRAAHLVPQDSSLRVRVASEMLRQNNLPAMRLALAPIAYNPHGGGENKAMDLLRLIDSGADAAAVRAAIGTDWDQIGTE